MSTQNPDGPLPSDWEEVKPDEPDLVKEHSEETSQPKALTLNSEFTTPTLTLPYRPADHHSTLDGSKGKMVDKTKPQLGREFRVKKWRLLPRIEPPKILPYARKAALRKQAAKDTLEKAKEIVDAYLGDWPSTMKFSHQTTKSLDTIEPHRRLKFATTQVKVINKDTLDAALALENARDIMEIESRRRVVVLNFANAYTPGGGWLNGAQAQEEQICYRSTLGHNCLLPEFYPMKADEGLYSSNVLILRENEERGFSWMWIDTPEKLPMVSVISLAATQNPSLDATKTKYKNQSERTLMEDNMRSILRVAAIHRHTRLVLGALGCGAFLHPPGEVAGCWVRVLQEKEFKGWFEVIVFAVLDKKDGVNFPTFKEALHNLEM